MRILSITGMFLEVFLSHGEGVGLAMLSLISLGILLINAKKHVKPLWVTLFLAEGGALVWGVSLVDRALNNHSLLYLYMGGFALAFFAILLVVSFVTFLFKNQ